MDGLLIVDKPSGPTSHDVVARVRRALRERRVGHTGTLDPMASGVLPLVVGRATRLARFLDGDKKYDATVRLGQSTDTHDHLGTPTGPATTGPWPGFAQIDAVLDRFRGTFLQQPPAFSAKKIGGRRSYDLARARARTDRAAMDAALPEPVRVTVHAIDIVSAEGPLVRLRIHCSAGFYVRSLAHELGAALGVGGHLFELRRVEAAGVGLEQAIPLADLEAGGVDAVKSALVPLDRMLVALPSVRLTGPGVTRARCGRNLGPADATTGFDGALVATRQGGRQHIRLLDPEGHLVAMAEAAEVPGALHASVVLI